MPPCDTWQYLAIFRAEYIGLSRCAQCETPGPNVHTQKMTEMDKQICNQASSHAISEDCQYQLEPAQGNTEGYNRGLGTKRLCLAGLTIAWSIGGALLAAGSYLWAHQVSSGELHSIRFPASTPHYVAELLPLALNVVVTLLNETLGFIHTVCLRWALHSEGRLDFNSNLRLLSSSWSSPANRWYSNVAYTVCLILSYSTPSQIFELTSGQDLQGGKGTASLKVAINAAAITILGVSFIGQAAIATWAWITTIVPTWSSSSLDVLRAAQELHTLQHVTGRCMLSVDQQNQPSLPTLPRSHQKSAWSSHREVRWILSLLFAIIPLTVVFFAVCYHVVVTDGGESAAGGTFADWNILPVDRQHSKSGTPFLSLNWARVDDTIPESCLITLAFVSAVQAILTLALHCAELIVNILRDETLWRRATTSYGLKILRYNSVIAAVTAWQTFLLFMFKVGIHWLFGLSITVEASNDGNVLLLRPVQMVYLMILVAVLSILMLIVATRKPKGPQPAAFGHLKIIADVIDEWSPVMFWGDKSNGHAGMSSVPLENIHMDLLYS
jgi:hypothetical protein